MGARKTRTGPRGLLRATTVGATVVALATGGWWAASAAPLLPEIPLPPQVPTLGHTYVTPTDLHQFREPDTRPPGTVQFGDALGAPPGGNADALILSTPDGTAKATFFTAEQNGPLTPFLTSGYYAKRDVSSTGQPFQFPSFQIVVDANGDDNGGFSTLTFEPVYQQGDNANQTSGTWNRYDTGTGLFCSTQQIGGFEANQTRCDNGGTKTLAEIAAANPKLVVNGFGINQGSGNPDILSAVDLLQVGTTTYNFERTAPLPPVVPEPEPEQPCLPPGPDDGPGEEPGTHPQPEHHDGADGHGQPGEQPGGENPDTPPLCES